MSSFWKDKEMPHLNVLAYNFLQKVTMSIIFHYIFEFWHSTNIVWSVIKCLPIILSN